MESEIKRLAWPRAMASSGLEELSGGTFTITNGGVFGSLLSTPILNPPQSGILGMHTIQKRPVVLERPDRDPADDVPGAVVRSQDRGWERGDRVFGAGEAIAGGSGAVDAGGIRAGVKHEDVVVVRPLHGHQQKRLPGMGRRFLFSEGDGTRTRNHRIDSPVL